LVRLRALVAIDVALNFLIDVVYVLLGLYQLLLQSDLLLLEGILGALSVLIDQVFNFIGHFLLVHRSDNIFAVGVELRREYFRHGLNRIGLVYSRGLLDELSQRLLASTHRLVQRRQEVRIKLLFGLLVELVVLLKQCLLGAYLV